MASATTSAPPSATPATETVIAAVGLGFSYHDLSVLEDVTLEVQRGEFLGLVGPNAGGKSTLLKLILGLLNPTVGSLRVLGDSPRRACRRIGYVPQYPLFPRDFPITVADAVLMGRLGTRALMLNYTSSDRMRMIQSLREVEVEDLAQRPVGQLSGGQLQRVLLARALVSDPEILILDEPTANIDHRIEGEIFDLLAQLNARMTILVVSHDIAFISDYVTRVACLNRTLMCHATGALDSRVIADLYGPQQVRGILHAH